MWPRCVYWQTSASDDGYTSLAGIIDTNCLTGSQRLSVAKQITRLFYTLHATNMVQTDVNMDDVYIRVSDGVMK